MKIRIVQIGKNKDKYISEGMNEFLKRLKKFATIEIVTLKELTASKTFTKEKVIIEEGEEILKMMEKMRGNGAREYVCLLDEKGKNQTSVEFAKMLEKIKDRGESLTFVIGGPYGLSEEVKGKASTVLSFSHMTFTHQMVRLILLEQIYRGFCIMTGKEYHNE